jgi:hypothetical protein
LFFKFAEDKFKEKFYQKKNIKKSFKLLLDRIERYETVQGSKDSDIDSDLVVKMFQYYNFLAENYKDCLKFSKKYKFEGILFLSDLYNELLRKKRSKKKLLQIINKNMTDEEIPYFYDFICKEDLAEIAMVRVLKMKENKLNDNFYEIIYDLYSKNIIEENGKLDKLLQNSNSFNLRYLIRKGDYENAYETIMKMNYLEFISNENAAYIMEVMRQVEDYDQLLTYKYRFIDSSFINDDTNLYYAIALSKFSFEDKGTSLLATVNFENITFINALSAIGNENQYPHDNLIEKFLENYHNYNEVLELFSFLKDFDKEIVAKYEDKLKEILPKKEFNILKGRIAFIQGKQDEAKELLKESDHYEDLRLLVPLSTDIEAKKILGRVVKKINEKKSYFENYKTFLPFSYKNIYLHKARNDLFTFNFQLFEILSNLHDLTGKLEIGNVITKFDPTQLHIYKELYYIYMDFQQDFPGALRILNKMLSLNPKDSELVLEKGKLLINEDRYDYALSFLFENKGLSNDILNYIADIYEKQGLALDAIDINKELLEKTNDIKYFVRIIELKYNLELYDEVIEMAENNDSNFHSEMITYFLGMSYYNLKDFEKAKELLTSIIFSD